MALICCLRWECRALSEVQQVIREPGPAREDQSVAPRNTAIRQQNSSDSHPPGKKRVGWALNSVHLQPIYYYLQTSGIACCFGFQTPPSHRIPRSGAGEQGVQDCVDGGTLILILFISGLCSSPREQEDQQHQHHIPHSLSFTIHPSPFILNLRLSPILILHFLGFLTGLRSHYKRSWRQSETTSPHRPSPSHSTTRSPNCVQPVLRRVDDCCRVLHPALNSA